MKKGTTDEITITSQTDSVQNVSVAIDNLLYSFQEARILNLYSRFCRKGIYNITDFRGITVVRVPRGLPVAHAFSLRCKQSCFARKAL